MAERLRKPKKLVPEFRYARPGTLADTWRKNAGLGCMTHATDEAHDKMWYPHRLRDWDAWVTFMLTTESEARVPKYPRSVSKRSRRPRSVLTLKAPPSGRPARPSSRTLLPPVSVSGMSD